MNSNELLDIATQAALDALRLIKDYRGELARTIETKSSTTDMVTALDRACEERIRQTISSYRPGDGFIGEESGEYAGGDTTWIVDPIDGTTNFVYGFPAYAVSIAAKEGSENLCSVVLDLPHEVLFTAKRGKGAYRNGSELRLRSTKELDQALVATGFSYQPAKRRAQALALSTVIAQVRDVRRTGAASLDLVAVAGGQVDAYYEAGLKPWDYEGGRLIVHEAGGKVGSLETDQPTTEMTIATNTTLFEPLQELLRAALADNQTVAPSD
jgi:myo-inositol-1(or 4)-monophosphatase